jgi:hypothetical protein
MNVHFLLMALCLPVLTWLGSPAVSAAAETLPRGYYSEPDQRAIGELAFRYRQEAAEMQDVAARLEIEAQLSARIKGETDRDTQHARTMAQEAWRHAELANERASEYRRLLPHGRVY